MSIHSSVETNNVAYSSLGETLKLKLSLNSNLPEDLRMIFKCQQTQHWETKFD